MPLDCGRCYIIAGLNGAGKTTFAMEFLPLYAQSAERDVRRRFERIIGNLFSLYHPLLDTLHFFDNSSSRPRLVFKEESGRLTILEPVLYETLRKHIAP